jgi:hypothetical protein
MKTCSVEMEIDENRGGGRGTNTYQQTSKDLQNILKSATLPNVYLNFTFCFAV